eukprot:TRINITY_DN2301_c0_g1_i1.p1 TRINITY_DN2301_c0_g1~~TRINITY_DN2301_c0_g1_i1.p1  ORF type:complete len:332 (-),score=20.26 TRINITY_DN2301_c0_g1_i1:23-1018(-)
MGLSHGGWIVLALVVNLHMWVACGSPEANELYDTCLQCKTTYPYYNYCPALSRCPNFYSDCLDCYYNTTQCVCLLGNTERNCSLLNEAYGKGALLCVWLPCSKLCAATNKGTNRSCLADQCPVYVFPALELGLVFGVGVPGLLFSAFACHMKLDFWTDPKYAGKRMIFHILCNVSSIAANVLFGLFAVNFLEVARADAFIFYACIGFAGLESAAMFLSYVSASCCPSSTGEINRNTQLDDCNKLISVNAYYIFYFAYLFCLGLFVDSYFRYSLVEHPIHYQVGAFARVVPLVVVFLYWMYYVGKKCGLDVGGALNPLLFGGKTNPGYRTVV